MISHTRWVRIYEQSSSATCMGEQRSFWVDCTDAQSCRNLRCSCDAINSNFSWRGSYMILHLNIRSLLEGYSLPCSWQMMLTIACNDCPWETHFIGRKEGFARACSIFTYSAQKKKKKWWWVLVWAASMRRFWKAPEICACNRNMIIWKEKHHKFSSELCYAWSHERIHYVTGVCCPNESLTQYPKNYLHKMAKSWVTHSQTLSTVTLIVHTPLTTSETRAKRFWP